MYPHLLLSCVVTLTVFSSSTAEGTVEDLVATHGYPLERHIVRTHDGYNLGVYRIPHGRASTQPDAPRPVVLMQHGLLDTCATFLMNGPNGSLGFILADAGFDIWLANSRGSTFSELDIQSNMDEKTFWDFSLDELIAYDLPATVEYVLNKSEAEKIVYLGHSQGSAIAHAWFSTGHPLTHRIAVGIMMAPVAYVKHITSEFLRALARLDVDDLLRIMGMQKFLPNSKNIHLILGPMCREVDHGCGDVLSLVFGYNPENLDPDGFETYFTYTPAGSSLKLMTHWVQHVRLSDDRLFRKFDYGTHCFSWRHLKKRKCNQSTYGSKKPPVYDMSRIEVPLVFFHGGHDALADLLDVVNLKETLGKGVLREEYLRLDYTHLDFVWGIDAPLYVYGQISKMIEEMNRNGTLKRHHDETVRGTALDEASYVSLPAR